MSDCNHICNDLGVMSWLCPDCHRALRAERDALAAEVESLRPYIGRCIECEDQEAAKDAERMKAERDAAIKQLGEEGRLRGKVENERDVLVEKVHTLRGALINQTWWHDRRTCQCIACQALEATK